MLSKEEAHRGSFEWLKIKKASFLLAFLKKNLNY